MAGAPQRVEPVAKVARRRRRKSPTPAAACLRINTARNRISARVAVPSADWITASPDSLWISSEGGHVTRLDPVTLAVKAVIPVGAHPLASTWANGEVWVPNIEDDTVSLVDRATNSVRKDLRRRRRSGRR